MSTTKQQPANGAVIYRGPSQLDGKPIIVVVTGLRSSSANEKTGNMLQTWILREDIAPHVAIKTGDDASICGSCPHRGAATGDKAVGRTCYVQVHNAPRSVYAAYHRGIYPMAEDIAEVGRGRLVRIGSYGDPAAVPVEVWKKLTRYASGWTGYTHQWFGMPPELAEEFQPLCMASVDSEEEATQAKTLGWRTFRVAQSGAIADKTLEVLCPASEEAGRKSSCENCRLCMGTTSKARKSVMIPVHGFGKSTFNKRAA